MENKSLHKLGIDIGSTTVKVAVLDEQERTICFFLITNVILPIFRKH